MFKEKYENFKGYVKEHKTELIVGTVCAGATVVVGVLVCKDLKSRNKINTIKEEIKNIANLNLPEVTDIKKVDEKTILDSLKSRIDWISSEAIDAHCRLDTACEIAYNSLKREKETILFEIEELENYIANLNENYNFNKFGRIPEKKAMINTLKKQLEEIDFDMNLIKEDIGFLMNINEEK